MRLIEYKISPINNVNQKKFESRNKQTLNHDSKIFEKPFFDCDN